MSENESGPAGPKGDKGDKGAKGDAGAGVDDKLFQAVDLTVARLIRQASRGKLWNRINTATAVLLVAVMAVVGYTLIKQHSEDVALRNDSVTSCTGNNAFREAQVETWEKNYALQAKESASTAGLLNQLIDVLARNNPTEIAQIRVILAKSGTSQQSEITSFLQYVATVDAGRNCAKLFGASAADSAG
jgi:hypothetical protein